MKRTFADFDRLNAGGDKTMETPEAKAVELQELFKAETLMAFYRSLTGDTGTCDADDIEGVMELMNEWAKSTGYTLTWKF